MSEIPFEPIVRQRQEIVNKVISDIESQGLGWIQPWQNIEIPPHNPSSGTIYSGINRFHLSVMQRIRKYEDPRWFTFNQAKKAGYKLKKGSKACIVEKWKSFKIQDKDSDNDRETELEEESSYRIVYKPVGYFNVFNASCFEGVPPLDTFSREQNRNSDVELGKLADDIIASSACPIHEMASDSASFSLLKNEIIVPFREQFESNSSFLGTLLHEMAHSTGPDLGRTFGSFGNKNYAKEELVAELSAIFSSNDLGFLFDQQGYSAHLEEHEAYLDSWVTILEKTPDFLFQCVSMAERASDLIIERYEQYVGHKAPSHLLEEELKTKLQSAIDKAPEVAQPEQIQEQKAQEAPVETQEQTQPEQVQAQPKPAKKERLAPGALAQHATEKAQQVQGSQDHTYNKKHIR